MLTLTDFRIMSFDKQCDIITFSGDYLMHRTQGDLKVFLYHAKGFYIEVFYSPVQARVLKITSFEKISELNPYLDTISLTDLSL